MNWPIFASSVTSPLRPFQLATSALLLHLLHVEAPPPLPGIVPVAPHLHPWPVQWSSESVGFAQPCRSVKPTHHSEGGKKTRNGLAMASILKHIVVYYCILFINIDDDGLPLQPVQSLITMAHRLVTLSANVSAVKCAFSKSSNSCRSWASRALCASSALQLFLLGKCAKTVCQIAAAVAPGAVSAAPAPEWISWGWSFPTLIGGPCRSPGKNMERQRCLEMSQEIFSQWLLMWLSKFVIYTY